MALSEADFSLLVVGLDFLHAGAPLEAYGVPLIPRADGFLLCLPHGLFEDAMVVEGEYPADFPSWLGIGSMFEVPFVEETDEGSTIPLGLSGPVTVIDVGNEVLARCREYDPVTDSDSPIQPFHETAVQAIPQLTSLLPAVQSWITERYDGGAPFHSAQEDPEVKAPPAAKAGQKKAPAVKRVTNASIMEQLNMITSQMQVLTVRQDALEKAGTLSPSAKGVSEQPTGRAVKFPALSDGLLSGGGPPLSVPKMLQVVGPPPKTQIHKVASTVVAVPPEKPNALLLGTGDHAQDSGQIVNALSQQSTAITALVAHLTQQDPLAELSSSSTTTSSMKGVLRREKLQAELAGRTGNFFLLLMQQVHKKLRPGRPLPKSEEELETVSLLEYLEKSGGYRSQRSLGLVQWITAHAVDAAIHNDMVGCREHLALLAMAVEQANYDNGDWSVAYLISLLEELPVTMFQERTLAVTSTSRPFSPLIPPAWTATTLGYLKDLEVLSNKKPDARKPASQKSQGEQEASNPPSPKRKPRFPRRPKASPEGGQQQ